MGWHGLKVLHGTTWLSDGLLELLHGLLCYAMHCQIPRDKAARWVQLKEMLAIHEWYLYIKAVEHPCQRRYRLLRSEQLQVLGLIKSACISTIHV